MNFLEHARSNLLEIVDRREFAEYARGNPYAEVDKEHFFDTAEAAKELWGGDCPAALVIASWYHDIDRAFPPECSTDVRTARRRVDTRSVPADKYDNQEHIKNVLHPENCAGIFRDYNSELPSELQGDISYLIERHEVGGRSDGWKADSFTRTYDLNRAADVLAEADALSFFRTLIYSYVKGRSAERVKSKVRFSYNKLSRKGKEMVRGMEFRAVDYEGGPIDVQNLVDSGLED